MARVAARRRPSWRRMPSCGRYWRSWRSWRRGLYRKDSEQSVFHWRIVIERRVLKIKTRIILNRIASYHISIELYHIASYRIILHRVALPSRCFSSAFPLRLRFLCFSSAFPLFCLCVSFAFPFVFLRFHPPQQFDLKLDSDPSANSSRLRWRSQD